MHTELLIYQPGVGKHPNAHCAAFVGKPVTALWCHPIFDVIEWQKFPDGHIEPVFSITWIAFVVELDRQVPASDLTKPKKANHA